MHHPTKNNILVCRTFHKIVEKTLGLNNFDYEIIDGFNTQNKHVLVEGNNCYLIYDMVITEKVLFSGYQKKKCGILNLNLQPKN